MGEMGSGMADSEIVEIRFSAGSAEKITVQFEPLGTWFDLADDDYIILRTPRNKIDALQVEVLPSGIKVWVAYPEDRVWSDEHIILDRHMVEIGRL
ncbi:hypothetical protein ACQPZ2_03160 [Nocardia pseudovaccinii]|uniref:hypothetical protein n=1 Tax=Nocardia pseudovaccinii TaxID=189540 RepID=UPI003D8FE8A8